MKHNFYKSFMYMYIFISEKCIYEWKDLVFLFPRIKNWYIFSLLITKDSVMSKHCGSSPLENSSITNWIMKAIIFNVVMHTVF